uniref:RNA polymerase II elongation factor ELL N-terminal domain-containing protein n=1 Tax=Canis lupus familiaris TaxID=9615 RepID=A0A8C0RLM0_CANLF
MAALKEARSYGLSCGRVSDGSKVSVFHVKLTDSALRAFESYRASQVSGVGPGAIVGDVEAQLEVFHFCHLAQGAWVGGRLLCTFF